MTADVRRVVARYETECVADQRRFVNALREVLRLAPLYTTQPLEGERVLVWLGRKAERHSCPGRVLAGGGRKHYLVALEDGRQVACGAWAVERVADQ